MAPVTFPALCLRNCLFKFELLFKLGTQVGDPEEILAIDKALCKNRNTPLLVGAVKSNMGHSEPSSGLCSITKVFLSLK